MFALSVPWGHSLLLLIVVPQSHQVGSSDVVVFRLQENAGISKIQFSAADGDRAQV